MKLVDIGKAIKARRDALGWTQKELSLRSGVAQGVISLIENGHRFPRPEPLEALALALGVVLDVTIDRTETAPMVGADK